MDLRPPEHAGMTFEQSYILLADLYRDVQDAHALISNDGRHLYRNQDVTRLPARIAAVLAELRDATARAAQCERPIPMLLWCPECGERHIDVDEFATKPHHTHACQGCGMVWRPAIVPTVGVQFLPGFKNS